MERKKSNASAELRKKAEAIVASGHGMLSAELEDRRLLHELQVHQVELEMQNEELRRANSQLKRLSSELARSEALYRSLVEASQDLIWQCNTEGRFTFLNPAWEQVYGYTLSEMLGKKFTDFQSADVGEGDYEVHSHLLAGTPVTGYETTHIGKRGNEIKLVFNARCIEDIHGTVIGASGSAYDITEQWKKLEAEAVTNDKKDRLLSLFVQNYREVLNPTAHSGNKMDLNLDQLSAVLQNDETIIRNKKLTKREREILILVGQGFTSKNITAHLGIREKTVEMHRTNLMKKLGTVNAATLGRWATIAAQMTFSSPKESMKQ